MKKTFFTMAFIAVSSITFGQSFMDLFTPVGDGHSITWNNTSSVGYKIVNQNTSLSSGNLSFDYLSSFAEPSSSTIMTFSGTKVGIGTTSPLQRLHVDGKSFFDGQVGIGTSSPSNTLDVRGDTNPAIKLFNTGNGRWIDVGISSCTGCYSGMATDGDAVIRVAAGSNDFVLANQGSGNIIIGNGYTGNENVRMFINSDGDVGIGSQNPDSKLTVKGKIHAEEVKVDLSVPADYVFEKYFTGKSELKDDYEMLSLKEVEQFVKSKHHLPNIPSAKTIQEQGLELGDMTNLLLQKIEELTLYTIEQEKRINSLESSIIKNQ